MMIATPGILHDDWIKAFNAALKVLFMLLLAGVVSLAAVQDLSCKRSPMMRRTETGIVRVTADGLPRVLAVETNECRPASVFRALRREALRSGGIFRGINQYHL